MPALDHRAQRRFIEVSPAVRQDNFAKRICQENLPKELAKRISPRPFAKTIREDRPSNNLRFMRNVKTNLQS